MRIRITDKYCQEAKDYFAGISARGGVLSNIEKIGLNKFIVNRLRDGSWNQIFDCGIALGGDITSSRFKLKSLPGVQQDLGIDGSIIYNPSKGWVKNTNDSSGLKTGFIGNLYNVTDSNFSFSLYWMDDTHVSFGPGFGTGMMCNNATGETGLKIGYDFGMGGAAIQMASKPKLQLINRSPAANRAQLFEDYSQYNTTGISVTTNPVFGQTEITLFKGKRLGVDAYSRGTIGFYHIGGNLTAAQAEGLKRDLDELFIAIGRKPAKKEVVFFGDSNTLGYGQNTAHASCFSHIVAKTLGYNESNSGVSGSCLTNITGLTANNNDVYNGIQRYIDLVKYIRNGLGVAAVYIMYGTNDMRFDSDTTNGTSSIYNQCATDISTIIQYLIDNGVPAQSIIVASPPYYSASGGAGSYGSSQTKQTNYSQAILNAAIAKGCKTIDINAAMWALGSTVADTLLVADKIHLNISSVNYTGGGHKFVADQMLLAA